MNLTVRTANERDREIFDWQSWSTRDGERRPLVLLVEGVIVLITGRTEPQYQVGHMTGDAVRLVHKAVDFWGPFMNRHSDYAGRLKLDPKHRSGSIDDIFAESIIGQVHGTITPAQAEVLRHLESRPMIEGTMSRRRQRRGATMRGILHNVTTATPHTVETLVNRKLVERRGSRYWLVRPARLEWDVEGEIVAEDDRPVDQAELSGTEGARADLHPVKPDGR